MIDNQEIIIAAQKAQLETIKNWLINRYADHTAIIARWSDHYFRLSSFSAGQVKLGLSDSQTRNRLNALAQQGVIERIKLSYGPVSYRFPRAYCDECATIAIHEWIEKGYSQTERRPE